MDVKLFTMRQFKVNKMIIAPLMTFASLSLLIQSFTGGSKADCCACRGGDCESHQHGRKNKEEQNNVAVVKRRKKKSGVIISEE